MLIGGKLHIIIEKLFSMFSRYSVNLNIDKLRSSKAINIIGFHLIVCGCYHQIIQLSKITRLFHENRCLCTHTLSGAEYIGHIKAAYSVTMKIFEKKKFLFKSFVKVELS